MSLYSSLTNGYISEESISTRYEKSDTGNILYFNCTTTTVYTGLTENAAIGEMRVSANKGIFTFQEINFNSSITPQTQVSIINNQTKAYQATRTMQIDVTCNVVDVAQYVKKSQSFTGSFNIINTTSSSFAFKIIIFPINKFDAGIGFYGVNRNDSFIVDYSCVVFYRAALGFYNYSIFYAKT